MDWLFRVFRRRRRPGIPEAERLAREAGEAPTVAAGLLIAEKIASFHGFGQQHKLQACYLMALINLTTRADLSEAEEIVRRLLPVTDYGRGPGPQQHHAQALGSAALSSGGGSEGFALARLMEEIPAFTTDASIQELHARVLLGISGTSRAADDYLELAARLERLPAFPESEGIQVECARALGHAASAAPAPATVDKCKRDMTRLPLFSASPAIQAIHARIARGSRPEQGEPPGERGRVWTVMATVEDSGGQPVVFRDETESVKLHVLAFSQGDARERALAMYCEMLRAGGHRITDDHVVDGVHRIKLMCID